MNDDGNPIQRLRSSRRRPTVRDAKSLSSRGLRDKSRFHNSGALDFKVILRARGRADRAEGRNSRPTMVLPLRPLARILSAPSSLLSLRESSRAAILHGPLEKGSKDEVAEDERGKGGRRNILFLYRGAVRGRKRTRAAAPNEYT